MKLVAATLYALRIPFVESFSHSATRAAAGPTRSWCACATTPGRRDSARAPRVPTSPARRSRRCSTTWRERAVAPRGGSRAAAPGRPGGLDALIPDTGLAGAIAPHASRAALELADARLRLRRAGARSARLLPPRRARVTYSGVITAGPSPARCKHARQMRAIGLRQIKVKVGFDDDVARVTAVREALGARRLPPARRQRRLELRARGRRPERGGAARASPPSSSRCRGARSDDARAPRRATAGAAHGRRVAGDAWPTPTALIAEQGGGLLQRPRLQVWRPRPLAGHRRPRRPTPAWASRSAARWARRRSSPPPAGIWPRRSPRSPSSRARSGRCCSPRTSASRACGSVTAARRRC